MSTQISKKCCSCNGKNGKCNNCLCVKNKKSCHNCAPGFNGQCNNNGNRIINTICSQPIELNQNYSKIDSSFSAKSLQFLSQPLQKNPISHNVLPTTHSNLTSESLLKSITSSRCSVAKYIQKKLRATTCDAFCSVLKSILSDVQDSSKWLKLFMFSFSVLPLPKRGGKRNTNQLNHFQRQLQSFIKGTAHITIVNDSTLPSRRIKPLNDDKLAELVCQKVEDQKMHDAVRLLSREHCLADDNEVTLSKLKRETPKGCE